MEPTKEQAPKGRLSFKRKRRIGFDLLNLPIGSTVYAEIKAYGVHDSKNHGDIEYFDIINLDTGEEQRMWVDGGLRGALTAIGEPEDCVGMKLEIKRNEKVEGTFTDENGKEQKTMINNYSVWELSH